MKNLFKEIAECLNRKEELVLVTVIAGSGSTPRGAGARMLIRQDGTFSGTIGGGNVEFTAQQMGLEVLKEKKSYSKGFKLAKSQVADLGMICGGDVIVYFQYISPENDNFMQISTKIQEYFETDENSWIITDITDETAWNMGIYSKSKGLTGMEIPEITPLLCAKAVQVEVCSKKYYSEPLVKAGTVYVFGGGHVAQELVPVIAHVGFRCVVFDDREAFANKKLFPDAEEVIVGSFENIFEKISVHENDYMAIMSRGHEFDYLIQKQALTTKAHYIGVMGSHLKMKTIAEKLQKDGFEKDAMNRFTSPIGLPILAETPAEIAISIAGELIQLRAQREKSERCEKAFIYKG